MTATAETAAGRSDGMTGDDPCGCGGGRWAVGGGRWAVGGGRWAVGGGGAAEAVANYGGDGQRSVVGSRLTVVSSQWTMQSMAEGWSVVCS